LEVYHIIEGFLDSAFGDA